jgi:hypothetical protein
MPAGDIPGRRPLTRRRPTQDGAARGACCPSVQPPAHCCPACAAGAAAAARPRGARASVAAKHANSRQAQQPAERGARAHLVVNADHGDGLGLAVQLQLQLVLSQGGGHLLTILQGLQVASTQGVGWGGLGLGGVCVRVCVWGGGGVSCTSPACRLPACRPGWARKTCPARPAAPQQAGRLPAGAPGRLLSRGAASHLAAEAAGGNVV